MPRIFDNIEESLLPSLQQTLQLCDHADFCVGYFNLRGWRQLHDYVERWPGGDGQCCRLLVGMQALPADVLRSALGLSGTADRMDNATALRLKRNLAEEFRSQLCIGAPTDLDEQGLRRLARQIKANKVVVKLFVKHPLHAKLYLLFRPDPNNPITGFLGSSNLTLAGLSKQGELNVDVLDHDATRKLAQWFEDRWTDHWCLDISKELVEIIETSWARETPIPPYHIYLKIAYCLSQEARAGLSEFRIPKEFGNRLFDFQKAAVKIAAHHINKRGGVMIGDVVGLGKTLMATAVARIFEDDHGLETLIICPKNLVRMWEDYRDQYRLRARVMSVTRATAELPECRRYRLVMIDESHNLRNRDGKRYRAIQEYIAANESRVVLLSATPYNKTYLDLASQLRLFVAEDRDLGIRPEQLLKDVGETEFLKKHQCPVRSLAAFEHSPHPDDWRELMRLYLVRRTRSFIQENYAEYDPERKQKYLTFEDGRRSYFPARIPRTLTFRAGEGDIGDQYGRLYCDTVVKVVNKLDLPRYGLGNYVAPTPHAPPTQQEAKHLADLSRAGRRLMGFCRTGLFKRLESSGYVFLQSIERHILRNYVFLHAIANGLPIPIGSQDVEMLDSRVCDEDTDDENARLELEEEVVDEASRLVPRRAVDEASRLVPRRSATSRDGSSTLRTPEQFRAQAKDLYEFYATRAQRRFKWLRSDLFLPELRADLESDSRSLSKVLAAAGHWDPAADTKLQALVALLTRDHPGEKILIFTQFADTARYLGWQIAAHGVDRVDIATGDSADPTLLAWRFSPDSNGKRGQVPPHEELRVLIATDVLSEGQNLQDCHLVVNYDLPWAIIRLIQRAGRVDRIGQEADTIACYSFLPAEGVDKIIRLRDRVRQRLRENQEVVGADECFFEDQRDEVAALNDLYTEKAGVLDGEVDNDVDLASYAYQVWKNAVDADPKLEKIIPALPPVVYSSKKVDEPSRLVMVDAASRRVADETKRDASSTACETKRDASSTVTNYFDPGEPIANLSGNLPHWRQDGVTYFVTFRLADSLPQEKLRQWLEERAAWLAAHPEPHDAATRLEYYRLFPERFHAWLDAGHGACVLARPGVKAMVEEALRHFEGDRYRLLESAVMPNHVHALVAPRGEHTLSQILHSWKSYTSHEIVKVDEPSRLIPKRQGTSRDGSSTVNHVWQQETFDHIVRNADQLERIRQYIRDNPKKISRRNNVDEASRLVSQDPVDEASRLVNSSNTSRDGSSTPPAGVLIYLKTGDGNDALAWVDTAGRTVTESQYAILRAAECAPETPHAPRHPGHHQLVQQGVARIVKEERLIGGQLGRPSGARFRTYERLKAHAEDIKGTLFESPVLHKAIEQIYRHPLRQSATDTLNRQLRSGIANETLAALVVALYEEERLCLVQEEQESREPRIICSMGLVDLHHSTR